MTMKLSLATVVSTCVILSCFLGCKSKKTTTNTPPADMVGGYSEGLACAKARLLSGFINKRGKIVIKQKFDAVGDFSEGLAWVRMGKKYGYIDTSGNYVIRPKKYSRAGNFRSGIARLVEYAPGHDNRYIFITKKGTRIYRSPGNFCGPFSEGYAIGMHEPQYGVMDTNGNWKPLKPEGVHFASIGEVSEGLIAFISGGDQKNFASGYVTPNGEVTIKIPYYDPGPFSMGRAKVSLKMGIGSTYDFAYIDTSGKLIIPGPFSEASTFSEGLAAVKKGTSGGNKWGYINKNGETVVPFKYDEAGDFTEGMGPVKLNKKWGFINKKGVEVIQPTYDQVGNFSEGLAMAEKKGRQGFIDRHGNVVIKFRFSKVGPFKNGLAAIRNGHPWGFVNKSGKFVIKPGFEACEPFSEGRAAVKIDALWGTIDTSGTLLAPAKYAKIHPYSEGRTCAEIADRRLWGQHYQILKSRIPRIRASTQHDVYSGGSLEGNPFKVLDENGKPLASLKNRIISCSPFHKGKANLTIVTGRGFGPGTKRVQITIDRTGKQIDTKKKK